MKKIRWNWANLCALVLVWSYGVYGALTQAKIGWSAQLCISGILFTLLFGFLDISMRYEEYFLDELEVNRESIFAFGIYSIFFLIISWRALSENLGQDEWYHVERSQLYGLVFFAKLAAKTALFSGIALKKLLALINFLTLVLLALFLSLVRGRAKFLFLPLVFLNFRLGLISMGGYADPHPPLRLLPLWLASTIFTPSAMSFHLAQMSGLIAIAMIVFYKLKKRAAFPFALLAGLVAATFPVLWHSGVIGEQSIWTAVAWTFLVLFFADYTRGKKIHWARYFALIAIVTLMRQTAIAAFFPLGLLFLFHQRKKIFAFKETFLTLSPVLLALPFFCQSILFGTPSTQSLEAHSMHHSFPSLSFLFANITKDILPLGVCFLVAAFLPLARRQLLGRSILWIFFLLALVMFYSIPEGLWVYGRYKAEYAIPFAIAGLCSVMLFLARSRMGTRVAMLCMATVIVTNTVQFLRLPVANETVDQHYQDPQRQTRIESVYVYNYKEALTALQKEGRAKTHFIMGVSYGTFPEILAGYSLREVMADQEIFKHLCGTTKAWAMSCENWPDAKALNNYLALDTVLITDWSQRLEFAADLKKLGWVDGPSFYNPIHGSTVLSLLRR